MFNLPYKQHAQNLSAIHLQTAVCHEGARFEGDHIPALCGRERPSRERKEPRLTTHAAGDVD